MQLRDYTYLGLTQSLCPDCLRLIPAKIVARDRRVYFRKRCPEHGQREDFVCADVGWYDRLEFSLPGKLPQAFGTEVERGCPFDCGLCSEHEQHTCVGLLEVTSSCNLHCPVCYAASGPSGTHLAIEECCAAIDALVAAEGRPEVLQLSGGEPTIHPNFLEILAYACDAPIDLVMINTNGLRFARDAEFLAQVAELRRRVEIYFQFDGFDETIQRGLRGEPILAAKMQALDALQEAGLNVTLVCTVQAGVNEDQLGPIVEFALARSGITGVSFQPTSYTGRTWLPERLEQRITFPDVIRGVAEQAPSLFRSEDFMPLPCAHPNGHALTYAYRREGASLPLPRFLDLPNHLELLANGITFNRQRARDLILDYLGRQACGAGACNNNTAGPSEAIEQWTKWLASEGTDPQRDARLIPMARDFVERAVTERLEPADVLRITITSFMDAYNFDVRQVMKSCVHHVLPSGHLIPFSAYNVLYRDGHVPLPPLVAQLSREPRERSVSHVTGDLPVV